MADGTSQASCLSAVVPLNGLTLIDMDKSYQAMTRHFSTLEGINIPNTYFNGAMIETVLESYPNLTYLYADTISATDIIQEKS